MLRIPWDQISKGNFLGRVSSEMARPTFYALLNFFLYMYVLILQLQYLLSTLACVTVELVKKSQTLLTCLAYACKNEHFGMEFKALFLNI